MTRVVRAEFVGNLDCAPQEAKTVWATCDPFLSTPVRITCLPSCPSFHYTCTLSVPTSCVACHVDCTMSIKRAMHHWQLAHLTSQVSARITATCGKRMKTIVLACIVLLRENAHLEIVSCVLRQAGFDEDGIVYWTGFDAANTVGLWCRKQNHTFEATIQGLREHNLFSSSCLFVDRLLVPPVAADSEANVEVVDPRVDSRVQELDTTPGRKRNRDDDGAQASFPATAPGSQPRRPKSRVPTSSEATSLSRTLTVALRFVETFARQEQTRVTTNVWQNEQMVRFLEENPRASWEHDVDSRRRQWHGDAELRSRACAEALGAAATIRAFLSEAASWD